MLRRIEAPDARTKPKQASWADNQPSPWRKVPASNLLGCRVREAPPYFVAAEQLYVGQPQAVLHGDALAEALWTIWRRGQEEVALLMHADVVAVQASLSAKC